MLSVYPVANNFPATDCYKTYANAQPLSRPLVEWFVDEYANRPADVTDLPGRLLVTIIDGEIDPLQTEGQQLADKLRREGVPVTYQLYAGVTHEFFGAYAVVPEAQQAQTLAATQLFNAFK